MKTAFPSLVRSDACFVERAGAHVRAPSRLHVLASALLLGLCVDAIAADARTACVGALTAVDVRVAFTPGTAVIDESKASRELESTGGRSAKFHQLGVTRATIERVLHVQFDESCGPTKVSLQLTVRPLVVELARELNKEPCLRAYVLEHEMQHVAIYNAAGRRAAQQLEREMRARLTRSRGDANAALREMQARIDGQWSLRLDALVSLADAEQDALDADQDQRAYRVCNGAIAPFLQTLK
jgi:hypothetical protein